MDTTPFDQDMAVTAAIFGVAAFVWFGWAQEAPPARWRLPLGLGSALGLLLGAVGGLLAWQNWGSGMALADPQARLAFGIVCGVEFGAAALGAAVLGLTKRPKWIASWIAFVVGAHFVPLAFIFGDPWMIALAVLVVLAAGLSVLVHRRTRIAPSAATGLGAGLAFLVFSGRAIALVAL
ncbi:hypothetical protein [Pseudonocardia humida]|uniref:Uncharacterized protein n=1 Tax=Pseudonocardia humida TaxID=2800819 RepID=A0ABT1A5G2_9PSEU|nr:hypothetical protein [Pseudonocardia humida]MCO1658261.1 hypothetical protein [Pseudonocardia humida]